MSGLQNVTALVGRLLLSAIFVMSGFNKAMNWGQTAEHMEAEGMAVVPFFLVAAILFEILGGVALIVGFRARLAALALVVFLVPVTLIFHDFWQKEGAEVQMQMIQFSKNVAILGGLLVVLAFGGGGLSVDGRSRARTPSRES